MQQQQQQQQQQNQQGPASLPPVLPPATAVLTPTLLPSGGGGDKYGALRDVFSAEKGESGSVEIGSGEGIKTEFIGGGGVQFKRPF